MTRSRCADGHWRIGTYYQWPDEGDDKQGVEEPVIHRNISTVVCVILNFYCGGHLWGWTSDTSWCLALTKVFFIIFIYHRCFFLAAICRWAGLFFLLLLCGGNLLNQAIGQFEELLFSRVRSEHKDFLLWFLYWISSLQLFVTCEE